MEAAHQVQTADRRLVQSYHEIERKDDSNIQRGVKMVDHFKGYANPIIEGDEANLYERKHLKVFSD